MSRNSVSSMSDRVSQLREYIPSRKELSSALETGVENIRRSKLGRSAVRMGREHPYATVAAVLGFVLGAWALGSWMSSESEEL